MAINLVPALSILLLLSLSRVFSQDVPAPGERFNLDPWMLQTVDGSDSALEIYNPELETYTSDYFYTDPGDLGMTFWCPVNGHPIEGSQYPRSELKELAEWTFSGTHEMTVMVRVLQEPPSGNIVIGQIIKASGSGSCSVIEELTWESGRIQAHQRDEDCDQAPSGGNNLGVYGLGEIVTYTLRIEDTLLTVTTDQDELSYDYDWMETDALLYFKAGNVVHDSGTSSVEGGRLKIISLQLRHG